MSIRLLSIVLAAILASAVLGQGPPNEDQWWLRAKGKKIDSYQQFRKLVVPRQAEDEDDEEAGSMANAHVIIEFYMQWCHFCKEFVEDWNEVVDETEAKHTTIGADGKPTSKVKFLLVDGTQQNELRRRYKVQGFPSFIYLKPGVKAKVAKSFENHRTRDNMIEWIDENVKKYDEGAHDASDFASFSSSGASAQFTNQQFINDFKAKQEVIKKMGRKELEQELIKMGNSFNSAGIFLNQQLGGLERDISAQVEKSKLFEEEYILKQKRISSLYKLFKEEFVRHQMFKDVTMFLVGFVGGLAAAVIFVIFSIPSAAQPVRVVQRKVDPLQDFQDERPISKHDAEDLETKQSKKSMLEGTGASSGLQMYNQDEFPDEENDSPGRRVSQRQPHSQRKKS